MKTNLKFLLALGGAKLVMLGDADGAPVFYGDASQPYRAKKTDIKRIAAALAQPR